ncbi:ABC transporter substrate-binding protein [Streptomyces sp. CB03234]|uniref:ABC transporter substrate-binding protein n=1 Tax=Streptomyces sp. (strain CB03234) TaxID=1703937 RepID=UPI00093BCD48|nr:ABC transporter substrate-binding protein [Streptomyces sp. CB03234]
MPHPLRYRVFYTTRQKIVTSVLVLALLAWGAVYAVDRLTAPDDRSCAPGVARPVGSDECVGVSGDGHDFGVTALTEAAAAIDRENDTLTAGQYVTVAVLLPLTSTSAEMRTKVVHEVRGSFARQYKANHDDNGKLPKIRLVLANTGDGNAHWRTAVEQLTGMTGAPHHLRAVSGIATSSAPVKAAVTELTRADIAVVGTTITADDIANGHPRPGDHPFPGLARVVPTNKDLADALANFAKVDSEKAFLVHDTRTGDNYTDTLKDAFSELLRKSPHPPQLFTSPKHPKDPDPTPNTFAHITHILCASRAETVFFAGRHTQLRHFVNALGERGCAHRTFTVLTGDEGSYLGADERLKKESLDSGLTVRYAALAHPDAWRAVKGRPNPATGGTTGAYADFEKAMEAARLSPKASKPTPRPPLRPVGLTDGQAIIAYDAMAAAVQAIRMATPKGRTVPPFEDVGKQWAQVQGPLRVHGASGWICLDNSGNPHNKAVPVVELTRGAPRFVEIAWPEGKPPTSDCLPPRRP